jgi:hypothetical protein
MRSGANRDGSRPARPQHEVTLRLDRLEEMFSPPAVDPFGGTANLRSGVERLVAELQMLRPQGSVRATIVLPAAQFDPGSEGQLRASVDRYCEMRIGDLERERAALRYDGISALAIGVPILLFVLLLSQAVRHSGMPEFLRSFWADYVLLVIAWVALWYPLDTLFYYGRPHTHELRALRALGRTEIVLVPADAVQPPPASAAGRTAARLRRHRPRRHRPRPDS